MSVDKKQLLDKLGFIWNTRDVGWFDFYDKLIIFKNKFGHCNVPHTYKEIPKLYTWIITQRQFFKNNRLDLNKKKLLDDLNFCWDVKFLDLKNRIEDLKAYYNKYGTWNISPSTPEFKTLASWVRDQRRLKKRGTLNPEIEQLLCGIGFNWTLH